jgi:hypothetical protein
MNWIVTLARRVLGRPSAAADQRDCGARRPVGDGPAHSVELPSAHGPTASTASRADGPAPGDKPSTEPGLDQWIRTLDLDKEKAQLVQEKSRLAGENARLWKELIERNARLDESAKAQMSAAQALRETLDRELELIDALLPNIDFLRDSREVLRDRLNTRRPALTVLRDLSIRPGLIKGTRVQAAGGWLERHFTTGDGSNGRIYYRYSGERCSVVLSFKADQAADIRYLQTL